MEKRMSSGNGARSGASALAGACVRAGVLACAGALLASSPAAAQAPGGDPFLWLEEIESPEALAWVEARSRATLEELSRHPRFQPLHERTLAVLNSRERIDFPAILGDRIYNFWQDDAHPRGVWRRTSRAAYLAGSPDWEIVIDVDALSAAEGVNWAWGGASCLPPAYARCLVRLSRGGADAVEVREFDAVTKRFVPLAEGGFVLPEAKQSVAWIDEDEVLLATALGPVTASGYARTAALWRRGTPHTHAAELFAADTTDMSAGVWVARTADAAYPFVVHRPAFFDAVYHLLTSDGLVRLDLPVDASPSFVADQLLVYLRSDWSVGGRTLAGGSLVAMPFAAYLGGSRNFTTVLEPGARETIRSVSTTQGEVLVNMLSNARGELRRYRFENGEWRYVRVPAPELGAVSVVATSAGTDRFFYSATGYTQPTTLYVAEGDAVRRVRSMAALFDASGLVVEQQEATSRDGTRVPYFVVRPRELRADGRNPTLLYGYGGFEISMTPGYNATVGVSWLEQGGVYVVANIRGGGEFGPDWHRAALRENRQRAFDDFIAVAEDLVRRGITRPEQLGIMGGSNGGILMGAMLTQRPELFDAVVIQVPLFDMRRYHLLLAGASWIAEYGDPDVPEDWAFISRYSPYQQLRAGQPYPTVLITTTTRDDRVHPGHARKAAARLEALGYPVYYFENTEGGHGAGVTNEQRATLNALTYTYLWKRLNGTR
jgi:prolyl oligopeptidase